MKKNTKKLRQILKVRISEMACQIQLKFETEVLHPEGVSTAKMVNFQSGTIELRMRENGVFLVTVHYILLCHAPALAALAA